MKKEADDILLIAGKGHEDYQIIGNRILKFDDAEVIRECTEGL
jgi:UDP-N-acetylmuramoyl-L-alanyl-D-glutamate--2,6-diaminopimelate ligase